jgi:hypothetical protein
MLARWLAIKIFAAAAIESFAGRRLWCAAGHEREGAAAPSWIVTVVTAVVVSPPERHRKTVTELLLGANCELFEITVDWTDCLPCLVGRWPGGCFLY